jgi:hypothetical protein
MGLATWASLEGEDRLRPRIDSRRGERFTPGNLGALHGQGEIVSGIIRVELNRSRAGKCCRDG